LAEIDELRDLIGRVKRLRLGALRRVRTRLAGSYASAFRGPGVEFSGFVPYAPGHDVRRIDWQVTARRHDPYVRRYQEERELRLLAVLDVSQSMDSGTGTDALRERACLVTAGLALSAAQNRDRVGALFFGQDVADVVPPRRGEKHALALLRGALARRSKGTQTDARPVLRRLGRLHGHAVAVLLSDFFWQPPPWDRRLRSLLALCAGKHDILAVRLLGGTGETSLADVVLEARESESLRPVHLDAFGNRAGSLATAVHAHRLATRRALSACRIPLLELAPHDDHLAGLERLLASAARRQ